MEGETRRGEVGGGWGGASQQLRVRITITISHQLFPLSPPLVSVLLSFFSPPVSPRPSALLSLASSSPSLCASVHRISFEFCNALQNFDLTPLDKFTQLEELNLNACRNITDSAIEIVAERCHKLKRLDLYWDVVLTDISMVALTGASFTPQLTHLNLSGLKHIHDAATVPLMQRCSSLTFLDLTRCEGLTDLTFKAIGATCHQLETLLLYATPNVTDVGFESLAPGIPNLTHLDITGMKLITDRAIAAIANHCPNLRVLHAMWCTALTDASLVALGHARLRHLRLLSVHGIVPLTAGGLEALAQGCTQIRALDINGCKNLGEYRMNKEAIKKILPKLQELIML